MIIKSRIRLNTLFNIIMNIIRLKLADLDQPIKQSAKCYECITWHSFLVIQWSHPQTILTLKLWTIIQLFLNPFYSPSTYFWRASLTSQLRLSHYVNGCCSTCIYESICQLWFWSSSIRLAFSWSAWRGFEWLRWWVWTAWIHCWL